MKFFVIRTLSGLQPCTSSDYDNLMLSKLKLGEVYEVEIKKKRNYEFHKKFFSLLKLVHENQNKLEGISIDGLRAYMTMKAGFYETYTTDKGSFTLPKSISFSAMDNIEFEQFYNAVIDVAISLIDCNREDLIEAIINY